LILFRDQASYEEANYNIANYYFLNVDRVHSSHNRPFDRILIFSVNFVNRNNLIVILTIKAPSGKEDLKRERNMLG